MKPLLRRLLTAVAVGLVALAGGAAALYSQADIDRARFVHPRDAVVIADRHGEPLRHQRSRGDDRRWVALDEVAPALIDAVVATEDQRFFEHSGVDPRATGRAAFAVVLPGRRVSGASTITQQLVKLVYGRENGLLDKPLEIARAVRLEGEVDKRWILEQYLNRLPYGDRVVGVERAARLYFGCSAAELSVGQSALIAGIPQAPSALDPRRHLEAATRRRRQVLLRMRASGRIDAATHRAALAEPVVLAERVMRPWRAPRFADAAVRAWHAGELHQSGGVVRTSLDLALQHEAEAIVARAAEDLEARGVQNGAAIVVDNHSGQVLAYVGAARQGPDAPGAWLDLVRARRQPGSTLKPFAYELFFERGGTAATRLDDLSAPMVGGDGTLFEAQDYDGRERGPVLARAALSASLNLAALDVTRRVRAGRFVERLGELGVQRLEGAERYGGAIVLGGADVSAWDLAGAYVGLSRGGSVVQLSLGGASGEAREVMESGPAAITRDILSDARARREAFGDDLTNLLPDHDFGLKTGTSSGWRDAWTAAFTDRVTVVVWLGDPSGTPLGGVSGFEAAAPPAVRLLAAAHRRSEAMGIERFERPTVTLVEARICALTGHRAGGGCAHTALERFEPESMPTHVCDSHRADGAVELPPRYARWIRSAHPVGFALGAPGEDEGPATPRIAHPSAGARLLVEDGREVAIPLRAQVRGVDRADVQWEVDGAPIEGGRWSAEPGTHSIVAVLGERRSEPREVQVVVAR